MRLLVSIDEVNSNRFHPTPIPESSGLHLLLDIPDLVTLQDVGQGCATHGAYVPPSLEGGIALGTLGSYLDR